MHPTSLRKLPHPRVNHRKTSCTRLPTFQLGLGLRAGVVTHGFESWFVVVIEGVRVSKEDIRIELSPSDLLSENCVPLLLGERGQ